jgi:transcriptional regulator with XRE-family HTH domain
LKLQDWERELESDEGYRRAAGELKPFLDLADDILAARLRRGWSQADLAERAGTKQANISRIESGLANPTLKFLQKLADALDIELVLHLHARKSDRAAEAPAREQGRPAAEGYRRHGGKAGELAAASIGVVAETPAPYSLEDEKHDRALDFEALLSEDFARYRARISFGRLAEKLGVTTWELSHLLEERGWPASTCPAPCDRQKASPARP